MFVTELTFQPPMSWLNAVASKNMYCHETRARAKHIQHVSTQHYHAATCQQATERAMAREGMV